MRRLSSGVAVLACGAAAMTGGAPGSVREARLPTHAPLAVTGVQSGGPEVLARLDPLTLAPRGPTFDLPEFHDSWSFSPDGRRVALGTSAGGPAMGIGIHILDVRSLRQVRGIRVPIAVEGLAWLGPRRLVGALQGETVFVADPVAGRTLLIRAVRAGRECRIHPPAAVTKRALVMLLGRRLVTVGSDKRVRTASLRGLPDACAGAAVVVDGAGRRAFVVAGAESIPVVDLRAMHTVGRHVTGPVPRSDDSAAIWLGHGTIAAAHTRGNLGRPAGVELIDTRSWTRRTIAPRGGAVRRAGRELLVFDGGYVLPRLVRGIGLRAYGLRGRPLWRVLRGERISNVQVAGRFAYAIGSRGLAVVDLRERKVVTRTRRAPEVVEFLKPQR